MGITLALEVGEFITQIEGRSSSEYITRLTFVTNKRTLGSLINSRQR